MSSPFSRSLPLVALARLNTGREVSAPWMITPLSLAVMTILRLR
jgi:hypothetical protein